MIRFKNLLSLSLLIVVVSDITALARPNAGYNGYRQKLLKTTGGCKPAEASIDLDINNVRAHLMTGGDMWWDIGTGEARYEVPKGSKKNSLFAGSLWVGGYDAQKQLKVAAQTYRQDGNDYWPGPLDVNAGGTVTAAACSDWDKFWKVNKSDIIAFIEMKRANPSAPVTDPRFESILKWPAKGNIYATGTSGNNLGLASTYLSNTYANFVDVDNDGKYDATKGDYPKIDGDQYIWWVFNDAGNSKQQSNTDAIKLEIQASAFAFTTKDAMNDATFYNYRMWNRGNLTLDSTFVSTWTDADLGWYQDDYIGCDTVRGLGILYNSKTVDGDGQINSYGSKPPMVGVDFFVGPIKKYKSPYTGLDTSRKLSMEAFTYFNNDNSPNLGNPSNGIQIYNYMTGSMRNGTHFHNDFQGLPGVQSNGTGIGPDTKFLFTGDLGKSEWTECYCTNPTGSTSGDRRFIHSSGPFVLEPGTSNDITIGVVWAADVAGCPNANFRKIRAADDLAQGLFDNGFKVVEGPEAPRLVIREMDKKLIMYLVNDSISNNFGEKFGYDTSAKYRTASGRAKAIKAADSLYKFEGYRVFQVKYPTTTAADIINSKGEVNTEIAQEVFQCDLKNGVSTIINYEKNIDISDTTWGAITKVKGANQGISHSFEITQDAFASGKNKSLVNYRNYYFVAVAYAYNQFNAFDPNPKRIDSTQTIAYLESAKGAGGISIPVVSAMPNPANGDMGTVLNAAYGSGVIIKRIEGVGNGGNALDLSDASEAEALNYGKASNLVYKPGAGPVNIKVIDPLKLKKADWELYISGRSYADTNKGIIPDSGSWRLVDITNNVTIYSERNIAKLNEQILEKYGMSVNIAQTLRPNDEQDQGNGYITSDVTFEDPTKPWLSGVKDGEYTSMLNWIRSGTYTSTKLCFKDAEYDKVDQVYEKMLVNNLNTQGTWAPYSLGADDGNLDSCGLNMVKSGTTRALTDLQSVDLVFTSDKSKWTRCVVLEMQPKAALAEGKIIKFSSNGKPSDLRAHRSLYIDNNGNPYYSSDPNDTAMSWFPGYAINQETGERLNIVFTEDSYQKSENGGDLIYNPTATTFDDFGNPIFGGRHFVYILSSRYDSCRSFKNELNNLLVPAWNYKAYFKFMWTGATMLNEGYKLKSFKDGIIPTTTRLRFRVRRPYARYMPDVSVAERNGRNPLYSFSTKGLAPSALSDAGNPYSDKQALLDKINAVPNPYYGYADYYESNRLDTRIKITNLPQKATVSIYSLDGTLIKRLEKDNPNQSFLEWDIRNNMGIPIASGMYLIHVKADGIGETVLKWFGAMRPLDITTY